MDIVLPEYDFAVRCLPWDSQNAFAYVEKSVEKRVREEERAKMLEEKRNIAREFKKQGVLIGDIAKGTFLFLPS